MILLSVGTQLPFDRLIQIVDNWVEKNPSIDVFAQIGKSYSYVPRNFKSYEYVDFDCFNAKFEEADLIISHAGMGNIIKALELGKPIIIMPRIASLGEHRNEHQLGTAKAFSKKQNVYVVNNEVEFDEAIGVIISGGGCRTSSAITFSDGENKLVNYLKEIID